MATSGRRDPTSPSTRAGILASGLVRIVKTPAQLDAEAGWWTTPDPTIDHYKPGRDYSKPPRRLTLADLPGGKPDRWLTVGHSKGADGAYHYSRDWSTRPTPVPEMSPAQLRSALSAIARRLSGHPDLDATEVGQ